MIPQTPPMTATTDSVSAHFRAGGSDREVAEEWRPVPGAEGLYSVSSFGRVRSEPVRTSHVGKQRGRILTCYSDRKGYPQFKICLPGSRSKTVKVHRIVALAFLGPRPVGAQINHKSGNKLDNSMGNLEYVTCQENIQHGWRTGLFSADHTRGENSHKAKLTEETVREIRRLRPVCSLSELARRFGVSKQNISQIAKGMTWRHVA